MCLTGLSGQLRKSSCGVLEQGIGTAETVQHCTATALKWRQGRGLGIQASETVLLLGPVGQVSDLPMISEAVCD